MKPAVEEIFQKDKSCRPETIIYSRMSVFSAGLGVAGFAFLLYLWTLAPTVLYYERPDLLDAAMLQSHVYALGITQPTGYPTYTMLAHLFTYLPFGDPAYQANLASAVFGAAAVFFLFLAGLQLSRRILAAAVGALSFAVGNTFWSQAIIAEVYTMNALFVSLVVLGLMPYLYLPVRALMGPPISEANPSNLARLWELVAGREFGIHFWTFGPDEGLARLASLWGYFSSELHAGVLLVAAFGIIMMLLEDRAGALLLGVPLSGWLIYAVGYDIFDYFLYFIPSYLMLAHFISVGSGRVLDYAEGLMVEYSSLLRRAALILISVSLPYLAVSGLGEDYPLVNRSQDLEERRKDLTLVSPWYPSRNPQRVWSASGAPDDEFPSAKSVSSSGVADARVAARKGPVYTLGDGLEPCNFQNTGFSVIRVQGDLLYEIVPPDRAPYTNPEEQQGSVVEPGRAADESAGCE